MTRAHPLASTVPMEAKLAHALPEEDRWSYEPKWDEFQTLPTQVSVACKPRHFCHSRVRAMVSMADIRDVHRRHHPLDEP